ncbi:MAG: hypothetical protein P0S94_03750 [Simkaniaceae bacterium]|nr:hypothetical protein [Simkaniaceae bacterium]
MMAFAVISHFVGNAKDDNGHFLFQERYTIERQGDQIISIETLFEDATGRTLATLASEFSDYRHFPHLSYVLRSKRFTLKQKKSTTRKSAVAGHGIYVYLLDHLNDLIEGKKPTIYLTSPDDRQEYAFVIHGKMDPERDGVVIATVELKNALLRSFLHPMEFHIESSTGNLLSYHGIDGYAKVVSKKQRIHIEYTHPTVD